MMNDRRTFLDELRVSEFNFILRKEAAMPRGDKCWVNYCEALRKRMFREQVTELTIAVEDVHADSGTVMTVEELRKPSLWSYCMSEAEGWDTVQKCGLELDYALGDNGYVKTVTFRLDSKWRETFERFQRDGML